MPALVKAMTSTMITDSQEPTTLGCQGYEPHITQESTIIEPTAKNGGTHMCGMSVQLQRNNPEVSYPHTFDQCRSPPISGATSQLRSHFAYGGFDHYWCYITNDFAPILEGLRQRKRCFIKLISTHPSATFSSIRGPETCHVTVSMPLAKLGLSHYLS